MIIEVLNANGDVITKVNGVADPEHETLKYKGASWRVWVQPDAERVETLRRHKIIQTRSEGIRRIAELVPAINNLAALDLMVELWPMLDTARCPPAMMSAKNIYVYAKAKVVTAQTATEAQLNAYNPATDPGWPT